MSAQPARIVTQSDVKATSGFQAEVSLRQALEATRQRKEQAGTRPPIPPGVTSTRPPNEWRTGVQLRSVSLLKDNGPVQDAEKGSVQALHSDNVGLYKDSAAAQTSTGFALMSEMHEKRRQQHEQVYGDYQHNVAEVHRSLRQRTIQAAAHNKKMLVENDSLIQSIFDLIEKQIQVLARGELDACWDQIRNQRNLRSAWMDGFSRVLEDIENERLDSIQELTSEVIKVLLDIGYMLEGDIERLLEPAIIELNLTMTRNRRASADLLGRMRTADLQRERRQKAQFQDCVERWTQLRHENLFDQFRKRMQLPETIEPPQRAEMFDKLKKDEHELTNTFITLIYNLHSLGPPEFDAEAASTVTVQLADAHEEVVSLHDEFLAKLTAFENQRRSLFEREFSVLREEVIQCGLMDEESVDSALAESCRPLIETRMSEGAAILQEARESLEQHADNAHQFFISLNDFIQHAALSWTEHREGLSDVKSDYKHSKEKLKSDDADCNAQEEQKLEELLQQLRQMQDEDALQETLEKVFAQLKVIEQGYRSYDHAYQTNAQGHVTFMEKFLNDYENELCSFFRVRRHVEPPASAEEEEEADMAGGKNGKKKQVIKPRAPPKAGGGAGAAGYGGGKKDGDRAKTPKGSRGKATDPSAGDEEVQEEQVLKVEGIHYITMPNGVIYDITSEWDGPTIEEIEAEAEAEAARVAAEEAREAEEAATKKGKGGKGGKDKESKEDKEAAKAAAAAEAKKKKDDAKKKKGKKGRKGEEEEEEEEVGTPEPAPTPEPEEPPLVPKELPLPPSEAVYHMKAALRTAFLRHYLQHAEEVMAAVRLLTTVDEEKAADLLDERLRKHRPRAGRAEMEVYQSRLRELSRHRGAFDRHVSIMRRRLVALQTDWNKLVQQAADFVQEKTNKYQAIVKSLSTAATPLSLKHIAQEAEVNGRLFISDLKVLLGQLLGSEAESVHQLKQANQLFLAPWRSFSEGGDLNDEELQRYRDSVLELNNEAETLTSKHKEEADQLIARCAQDVTERVGPFQEQFALHEEDVAFIERVHHKVGTAQTNVKIALSSSKQAAETITSQLTELEHLIAAAEQWEEPTAEEEGTSPAPPPIPNELIKVAVALRQALYDRGVFLQAYKDEDFEIDEITLTIDEESGRQVLEGAQELEEEEVVAAVVDSKDKKGKKGGKDDKKAGKDDKKGGKGGKDKKGKEGGGKGGKDKDAAKKKKKEEKPASKKAGKDKGGKSINRVDVEVPEDDGITLLSGIEHNKALCLRDCMEVAYDYYEDKEDRLITRPDKIPADPETFQENIIAKINHLDQLATDHSVEAIDEFRAQVTTFLQTLSRMSLPIMSYIQRTYRARVTSTVRAAEQDYQTRRHELEERRAVHQDHLRAGLKSTKAQEALMRLLADEEERARQAYSSISIRASTIVGKETEVGQEFFSEIIHFSRLVVQLLSSLVHPTDIINDEAIEKKPKTLRRLLRDQHRLEAEEPLSGTRVWPGLASKRLDPRFFARDDLQSMQAGGDEERAAAEKAAAEEAAAQAEAEAAAADKKKKTGASKKDKKSSSKKDVDAGDAAAEGDSSDEGISPTLTCPRSKNHRAILKARNDAYEAYRRECEDSVQEAIKKWQVQTKREQMWAKTWVGIAKAIQDKPE